MPPASRRLQASSRAFPDLNTPRHKFAQTSRLLTIPPELRAIMFDHLLPQHVHAVLVQPSGKGSSKAHHLSAYDGVHGMQRLGQACRQLRSESSQLVGVRSYSSAREVLFVTKDIYFRALEGYLTLVSQRSVGGLAAFMAGSATRELTIEIKLPREWCNQQELKHFSSWVKFIRDTAQVTEAEEFAFYRFVKPENKKLAVSVMDGLSALKQNGKEWSKVWLAFVRWYRFRGAAGEAMARDMAIAQQRLDNGMVYGRELHAGDIGEDGGRGIVFHSENDDDDDE
ncbi:hypothetical protein LTR53_006497 [Teratosphaeriaceae sp. CCFEE 6253]|nr:hypothetical protein LTR53_006497 [Teratosphaeriaceae sp. CCFEE 6253]